MNVKRSVWCLDSEDYGIVTLKALHLLENLVVMKEQRVRGTRN